MNAFVNEMMNHVNGDRNSDHDTHTMYNVFDSTAKMIGSIHTHIELGNLITKVNTFTNDYGSTFMNYYGVVSNHLVSLIYDDIRMMNVAIDSSGDININGNCFDVDELLDGDLMLESYAFLFIEDKRYDELLMCDFMDHHSGQIVNGDDYECKCRTIILESFMRMKHHAIHGIDSSDIDSATLGRHS